MAPAAGNEDQQRAAVRIALLENRGEIAGSGGAAKDARDFEPGGETLAQAASRSSAPISTAASASRLRAPRIFSSVAA